MSDQAPEQHSGAYETLADRQRRRVLRRWKRRARILSPFLGIPLVLGALALSLGLVKHLPHAQAAKAQGRAAKPRLLAKTIQPAESMVIAPSKIKIPSGSRPEGTAGLRANSTGTLDPDPISLGISHTEPPSYRLPAAAYQKNRSR